MLAVVRKIGDEFVRHLYWIEEHDCIIRQKPIREYLIYIIRNLISWKKIRIIYS